MLSRLSPERERTLVRAAQATRTTLALLVAGFVIILLVEADPNHQYASGLLHAAFNWAHAAFPTLIK